MKPILHTMVTGKCTKWSRIKSLIDTMKRKFADIYEIVVSDGNSVNLVADNSTVVNLAINGVDDMHTIVNALEEIAYESRSVDDGQITEHLHPTNVDLSGGRIVHVKIKHIVDPLECNYMRHYANLKKVIGNNYELFMTDATISIDPDSVSELIEIYVDSDTDDRMTQMILSQKIRFMSIKEDRDDTSRFIS